MSIAGIYLTSVMIITGLALASTCLLLRVYHQNGVKQVPEWLVRFSRGLAAVFCLKVTFTGDSTRSERSPNKPRRGQQNGSVHNPHVPVQGLGHEITSSNSTVENGVYLSNFNRLDVCSLEKESDLQKSLFDTPNKTSYCDEQMLNCLNSIADNVNYLKNKIITTQVERGYTKDWQTVARVLDRLLFIIFLILDVSCVVGILVLYPSQ